MNLNDPFGRIQKQREKEYAALCKSLQDAGLDDAQKAEELIETLAKRGKTGIMIVFPITLAIAFAVPEYQILVVTLGVMAAAWLYKTTKRSREYIRRYIDEELTPAADSDSE